MSGAMRKVGVYLGLLDDAEGDYAELDKAPKSRGPAATSFEPDSAMAHQSDSQVVSMHQRKRSDAGHMSPVAAVAPTPAAEPLSRITTLHPRTYNDARVIGENFRDGIPVIMNLTELTDAEAKRLVDFAAGLVFAVHGTIERVTSKVFLLSPAQVEVAAEASRRVAEDEFFNQS